jgi:hypothetical protein
MFLIGSVLRHSGSQAKGAYSTPVQVVNTSSAPAMGADVEKLARIPYESTATASNCSSSNGNGVCFYNFTTPPSGYRVVVENLSGYFQISAAATAPLVGYVENGSNSNPPFRIKAGFTAPLGQLDAGNHIQCAFDNPTRFYIDSTEGVFAVASANWSNGNSEMIASGYMENCSITGCPAVQH